MTDDIDKLYEDIKKNPTYLAALSIKDLEELLKKKGGYMIGFKTYTLKAKKDTAQSPQEITKQETLELIKAELRRRKNSLSDPNSIAHFDRTYGSIKEIIIADIYQVEDPNINMPFEKDGNQKSIEDFAKKFRNKGTGKFSEGIDPTSYYVRFRQLVNEKNNDGFDVTTLKKVLRLFDDIPQHSTRKLIQQDLDSKNHLKEI